MKANTHSNKFDDLRKHSNLLKWIYFYNSNYIIIIIKKHEYPVISVNSKQK